MGKRIFYACQAVGINDTVVHGVQSVGINTTFNLEQVFEIGMITIYENIENIPDVEVTLEKVLDGYPLMYKLATGGSTLTQAVGQTSKVALSIFDDTQTAATGVPVATCTMSGLVVSQVSYKANVNGNITETLSLVGNNKKWQTLWNSNFPTGDTPSYSGGVLRRQHINISGSTIPACIPANSVFQSVTASANINREQILELGRKTPYLRYAKFPVEITSDFEILARNGDQITVYEDQNNLVNYSIILSFSDGTVINMGTKNKLRSANYQGGGTDGNNATIVYSFATFNDFTVS